MAMNYVALSGNLTRDPEMRATKSGSTILTFGIAVNDRVKNGSTGEWEDYPNFFDCVVFGKRAESLSRILAKGMKVALGGKLRYSSWEKDGQRRSKIEVIVDSLDFMSRKGEGQQMGGQGGGQRREETYAPAERYQSDGDFYDDDIPF
jgi:single-strand DNA-binding protein